MALSGTYTRSLDEKQRLAVPKRICEDFHETDLNNLYVAPGTDKSLVLYSPAGFEKLARKFAKQSSNRVE
ncbi:MAG TPA: MraZ N-terminal domain-containing protein, partial [Planctomycetaceae bacterium]|nr:MraZ N-terminal domain-containing protein [Planctomycetaceae bacterium]